MRPTYSIQGGERQLCGGRGLGQRPRRSEGRTYPGSGSGAHQSGVWRGFRQQAVPFPETQHDIATLNENVREINTPQIKACPEHNSTLTRDACPPAVQQLASPHWPLPPPQKNSGGRSHLRGYRYTLTANACPGLRRRLPDVPVLLAVVRPGRVHQPLPLAAVPLGTPRHAMLRRQRGGGKRSEPYRVVWPTVVSAQSFVVALVIVCAP